MGLREYQRKRSFDRTPEPAGTGEDEQAGGGDGRPSFVVQRHRARALHYDFRLEIDGVLVSWAVPKGVTLDPSVRHLAVHVEDHPLEYAGFEGVIPAGEYGGGDVIVWDRGTWEHHGDESPRTAVDNGEIHLELFGEKLRGRIVLVRTRVQRGKEQWIVLHKRDEYAVDGWDPEDHPRSVLSGRTNDEVADHPDREWTRAGERLLTRPTFTGATPDELADLDALPAKGTWTIHDREVALTNLDKVLFPRDDEEPVTKRDLVRYYTSVAPTLLPYLYDRPLNLHRYPNGSRGAGFWQKQVPAHAPEWITRWQNPDADAGETDTYLVADDVATLAWLANHAAVELHPWTSTLTDPARPTYALIDIDPGSRTTWDELLTLARLHRDALEHLGVRGYPKVSGRRGIQVFVPIEPGPTFGETRAWVEDLSRVIGAVAGDLVSWEWEKRARHGKARLDFTQNAVNKTLVAPYSVRPADGAPVSIPITWDELDDPALRADGWTIARVPARLATAGDPMAPMLDDRQHLVSLDGPPPEA